MRADVATVRVNDMREMTMQDWLQMTARDLGRGIGAGTIDPVALAKPIWTRSMRIDLRDRIYARDHRDRAVCRGTGAQRRVPNQGIVCPCWMVCRSVGKTCSIRPGQGPKQDQSCSKDACLIGRRCFGERDGHGPWCALAKPT